MNKSDNNIDNIYSIIFSSSFIVLTLVVSRLIPHPPNFTPIIASAVFAPYIFKSKYFAVLMVLLAMLISDFFLGFHKLTLFIYTPLIIIFMISQTFVNKINKYLNLFFTSIFGALIFFIISNFGVWLVSDLYPNNLNGLIVCYFMALPFFQNTLLSTIFFVLVFLTIYQSIIYLLKNNLKLHWS